MLFVIFYDNTAYIPVYSEKIISVAMLHKYNFLYIMECNLHYLSIIYAMLT